jgi:hypothetical protein
MPPARLKARMDSLLSFPVGLFHPLQHAGLSRRSPGGRQTTRDRALKRATTQKLRAIASVCLVSSCLPPNFGRHWKKASIRVGSGPTSAVAYVAESTARPRSSSTGSATTDRSTMKVWYWPLRKQRAGRESRLAHSLETFGSLSASAKNRPDGKPEMLSGPRRGRRRLQPEDSL